MVNCIGGGDAMKLYETSLLPVDVGFDVKDQVMPVEFPEAEIYKIKYCDKYGRELVAAGEWERVSRTLNKAGYKTRRANPTQPTNATQTGKILS